MCQFQIPDTEEVKLGIMIKAAAEEANLRHFRASFKFLKSCWDNKSRLKWDKVKDTQTFSALTCRFYFQLLYIDTYIDRQIERKKIDRQIEI